MNAAPPPPLLRDDEIERLLLNLAHHRGGALDGLEMAVVITWAEETRRRQQMLDRLLDIGE